jgi:hypothetical protein
MWFHFILHKKNGKHFAHQCEGEGTKSKLLQLIYSCLI